MGGRTIPPYMPNNQRWIAAAELASLAILLLWLAVLPLPFGSIIEQARFALLVVPLAIGAVATLLRLYVVHDRTNTSHPTRPLLIWTTGALIVIAVGALQLVPLPGPILRVLSPESFEIWSAASRVASFAGVKPSSAHPISIDPAATAYEVMRIIALFATFISVSLLARNHTRRVVLTAVLCIAALFEAMYGLREAALQRYEIWGWVNRLIFHRVTGTFVNPNHFAHYMAIVLPMALFIGALAWHRSGNARVPIHRRLAHLIERNLLLTATSILVAIVCLLAILLAQSRGALLAAGTGILIIAGIQSAGAMRKVVLLAIAGIVLVIALGMFLGPERSIRRFVLDENDQRTLGGRLVGISAGVRVWQRFPIFGSGLGTFERTVLMEQRDDHGRTYHHAHNDYVELAATAGTIGFLAAIIALFAGSVSLMRMTFGAAASELSWQRRAFQTAALASLTIAMIHALFDFNFFIPSNAATLAAILGAAVSVVDRDRRTRR